MRGIAALIKTARLQEFKPSTAMREQAEIAAVLKFPTFCEQDGDGKSHSTTSEIE
jgi:hypothetical protein